MHLSNLDAFWLHHFFLGCIAVRTTSPARDSASVEMAPLRLRSRALNAAQAPLRNHRMRVATAHGETLHGSSIVPTGVI